MPTEADTCRKFVVPKLLAAGWDNEPHNDHRVHQSLDGRNPGERSGQPTPTHAVLAHYAWRHHCRGLFQMPIMA
jgi:hypothetical protein